MTMAIWKTDSRWLGCN